MKLPKDLRGDGRRCISPRLGTNNLVPKECYSRKMTMSQARMIVREFERDGYTIHSAFGHSIWVVVEWCELNGHKCSVSTSRGDEDSVLGYVVTLDERTA